MIESERDEPLLTLYTDTPERFARAKAALTGGWNISDDAYVPTPLILDRFS